MLLVASTAASFRGASAQFKLKVGTRFLPGRELTSTKNKKQSNLQNAPSFTNRQMKNQNYNFRKKRLALNQKFEEKTFEIGH